MLNDLCSLKIVRLGSSSISLEVIWKQKMCNFKFFKGSPCPPQVKFWFRVTSYIFEMMLNDLGILVTIHLGGSFASLGHFEAKICNFEFLRGLQAPLK